MKTENSNMKIVKFEKETEKASSRKPEIQIRGTCHARHRARRCCIHPFGRCMQVAQHQ